MAFDLSNYKILIIDDFSQMRNSCRRMLMDFKAVNIDDAPNGEVALDMMRKNNYDIILCDYNLNDDIDGQNILEEARHEGILDFASIFMMITAENTSGMVLSAVEYEPDDYLTKPFTKEVLALRIKRLIERKQGLKEVVKAVTAKDYGTAIQLCDRIIQLHPKNAISLFKMKGLIHLEAEEHDLAADVYDAILETHNIAWARMGQGKVKFITGDFYAAKDIFSRLISDFPNQMEAYDWLAKTCEALGEIREAQAYLQIACTKSPKVLVRRQRLADIAVKNNDLETAEATYRSAIKLSKGSGFKRPEDFTRLAGLLLDQKRDQKALQYLKQGRDIFLNQTEPLLKITLSEGHVHYTLNRETPAREAVNRAAELHTRCTTPPETETSLELGEASLTYGNKEQGIAVLKNIIINNHDNLPLLERVRGAFAKAGMTQEGEAFMKTAVTDIINLNNEGARLANEGKMQEAIELFTDAARKMPRNKVVNLNAAQAMIVNMERNGVDRKWLAESQLYLNNVAQVDQADRKYRLLLDKLLKLQQAFGQQNGA